MKMVQHLLRMELAGIVALGEWLSGGDCEGLGHHCTTVDFVNTGHLGHIEFINQHESKSNTRGNDAIEMQYAWNRRLPATLDSLLSYSTSVF